MSKGKKAALITAALIVIIGVVVCFFLAFKGLLGFYHPQQKANEGQIKVACVGDSITYGFGINNRDKNNYPAQLGNMLGDDYIVNNYGYSGRCVQSTADRPYVNESLYRESLAFEPDIVVFMLGSNDSKAFNWNKDNFIKDYKVLVESYINLPSKPKIYLMAPPPVFEVDGKVNYNIEKDTIANEIVPIVKSIGAEKELKVIDLYSAFENRPELFSDGCHPTAEGALLIAAEVERVILSEAENQ